ncbi:type I-D CRISPR-associated protein Cas7/Csc2 [Methanosarcina mazei]|uniref:CRISPR-associated protein Csc2 n=1 Tax=Methanosarcina mazei TaxID=2209 RepID=A0A0F8K5K9_METMZ|nr:type I-D CRISPR-associated protein Cas7/Csc2 [Methanosarcina mazei]KKG76275.1 hypothetical protein DU55_00515 [Methanosarcina mazei]
MNWEELIKIIPDHGFVNNYEIYRRARPTVTIIVLRTVTDPILFRNADSERAETQEFNGRIHAQVNPEKFVSKERLTGLNLCRELDENENIISKTYTYNEPTDNLSNSQTADLLVYGLAGTVSGATFSQKSRVIEGYTYSLEPYDLIARETHNAIYESGTMRNERGEQSEALFNPVKVQPGTHFVHFITLEAGTKEMFLYILHNVLNSGRYGARETRSGRNMKNEIMGLISSSGDSCLSCGEFIQDCIQNQSENEFTRESIKELVLKYIDLHKRADWRIYYESNSEVIEENIPEENKPEEVGWVNKIVNVANKKNKEDIEIIAKALQILREQGLAAVNE